MTALSARLSAIADLCVPARPLADIGSDHALLPLAMLAAGRVPRAIVIDRSPGPVAQLLALARCRPGLDARPGDGLRPLAPGEAHTIVIAGMGGRLMARILGERPAVVAAATRVVLQPNEDLMWLRGQLPGLGLRLVDQRFTLERGRCFFTDAWAPQPGPQPALVGADALVGPVLLAAPPPPALLGYLNDEADRLDAILAKVGRLRDEAAERRAAVADALARLGGA